MDELTKQERKVLSNFMGSGSYSQLEQWKGKFYWGGEVVGSRPVTIGPVYDSLLRKGFLEYLHGNYSGYGGIYRRSKKVEDYRCQHLENDRRCHNGRIWLPSPENHDDGEKVPCKACEGTGLNLKPNLLTGHN